MQIRERNYWTCNEVAISDYLLPPYFLSLERHVLEKIMNEVLIFFPYGRIIHKIGVLSLRSHVTDTKS